MSYSYEFKLKCIEMYYQGLYPETPEGVSTKGFHNRVRDWVRMKEANGLEVLHNKNYKRKWTPEDKYKLVIKVIGGKSSRSVAFEAGVSPSVLARWVIKYKQLGYNGLINKKGHIPVKKRIKKIGTRKPLNPHETEYEELIRLRSENKYLQAEIEIIKKEIALREEREAAQLKAKKQQSSKNYVRKDTN